MHILASKYKAHKELGITHELFSMLSVVMIIIRKDSASTRGVSQYIIEAHEILLFPDQSSVSSSMHRLPHPAEARECPYMTFYQMHIYQKSQRP